VPLHVQPGERRLLRGTVLGIAILGITVAGHAAGGGHLPSIGYYLALLPLIIALAVAASGRRRGPLALLGLAVGLQALMHVLLLILGAHATAHAAGGSAISLLPSASMLAVHAGAAVVVAIALARGDALLDRWIAFWSTFGARCLDVRQPLVAPRVAMATTSHVIAPRTALAGAIARRGPPAHS